jgi:hypothetical protein
MVTKIIQELLDQYFQYLCSSLIVNPLLHGPWEEAQPTARGLMGPLQTNDIMLIKDDSDDITGLIDPAIFTEQLLINHPVSYLC